MEEKLKWSYEQTKCCCEVCIDEYVVAKTNRNISDVIGCIQAKQSALEKDSIRMKLQNIKYLLGTWHVQNTLPLSPLENASNDTIDALAECLKARNISWTFEG